MKSTVQYFDFNQRYFFSDYNRLDNHLILIAPTLPTGITHVTSPTGELRNTFRGSAPYSPAG